MKRKNGGEEFWDLQYITDGVRNALSMASFLVMFQYTWAYLK